MYFWRAILASILSLICTIAVSAFVTLQTLQTTVMDKQQVKTWLADSGVYNNLLNTVISSSPTAQQQLSAAGAAGSTATTALNQTFTPAYVQKATEQTIDSTYDWLYGKQPNITFSINTTDQKAQFASTLSALLQPQLASLPRCTSISQFNSQNPTCLPPGMTAQQAATAVATDASNTSLFTQPLTNQTLAQSLNNPSSSPLTTTSSQQLPQLVQSAQQWLIWLPIIAVVSGALMVLLSQHKLKAAKHLAGKLAIGLLITCAIGLVVANVGKTFALSNYISGTNSTLTTNVVEPVLRQAAPAIGNRLAWVSGILAAITGVLWIVLLIIQKRNDRAELLKPPADDSPMRTTKKPAELTQASAGSSATTQVPASTPEAPEAPSPRR